VARYTESLEWLDKMTNANVVIYNKGSPINRPCITKKNIGREVESFLYHVINNYDVLPDYLVFVQGNPFDHMTGVNSANFQKNIDDLISGSVSECKPLFANTYVESENEWHRNFHLNTYYRQFFDSAPPAQYRFAAGVQYIIPKAKVLSRPLSFYQRIHEMTLNTPILTVNDACNKSYYNENSIHGWCLERLFLTMFMSEVPITELMRQKRYLVTGGAGFIGSTLVKTLSNQNRVIIVDNLTTGDIKHVGVNSNTRLIIGDVQDTNVFDKIGHVDGIFHMAAMSKVAPSLENPNMVDFCVQQNINGTIGVLKYAASFNKPIKVVYSASSTYYGLNPIPNVETQLPDCQTPYALTKYCGELFCELFSKLYNVPTVRLKYFMVFGPNEPATGSYAVVSGIFLKRARENLPLIIHGDGLQTRDFVHVDDVCKANILAMDNNTLINDTINVGTGKMISIKELANLISSNQQHIESRKIDLKQTLCDTTKLREKLGWVPTISITDYINKNIKADLY
jgi:nucleoside-diphosphate-sugar epimerase